MKRWLSVIVVLGVLAGLIVWRFSSKKAAAAQEQQARQARMNAPARVDVAPASVRDVVSIFEAVGTVEAPFNVKISPKVTGRIDYLMLREGDHVTRGQVLARVDPSEVQAQVQQAQANLAEAQSRLAQAQLTQNPTNVSVSTAIQQQAAALSSVQADYNQTRQNYASQVASAEASVTDAEGRVNSAQAAVGNAQASIESAQANLSNAQSHMKRVSDLYKQGFIAAQDVDDARTQVSVQTAALSVARGQLNSANAAKSSANAQLNSAKHNLDIVKTKGQADIEAARAKVVQAKAALQYAKANVAQRPAYEQNIIALKSAVAAARGALANAKAQLSNTVLTSPIDGFVTGRYMDPGAVATAGTPVLAVQAIRQVWVTVPVPEEVNRKVRLGMPATALFDALPGSAFTGKITQINPSADPNSRQFSVRLTLDNARNLLKPGMFARVHLETDRFRQAIVVPREAVKRSPDGASVTVVDTDGVAHVRPVTTGPEDADGIAIQDGIQPGEKVVVMMGTPVKDGQKVNTGGGRPGKGGRGGAPHAGPAAVSSAAP